MDDKKLNELMNCALDTNLNLVSAQDKLYALAGSTTDNKEFTALSMSVGNSAGSASNITNALYTYKTGWDFWERTYYPDVIRESYPIYIKERAEDKGRQAFEVIKHLQDKKLMKLDTVRDFIEAMDTLLKIL